MPLRVVKLIHMRSRETLCVMPNMLVIFYIRLGDVYLSNMKCLCMWSVIWCLSCLLYVVHCSLHFHVFIHLHLVSHLGTLDAPREGRDVELTRRWCWWIHPKDKRIRQVLDWGMLAKRVLLTNSDLSRIPGKPQSIISLLPSK
jgi:hypothetical protein